MEYYDNEIQKAIRHDPYYDLSTIDFACLLQIWMDIMRNEIFVLKSLEYIHFSIDSYIQKKKKKFQIF